MPYNKDIGANELYKIVMVVSGQVLHQLSVERSRFTKFLKFYEVILVFRSRLSFTFIRQLISTYGP